MQELRLEFLTLNDESAAVLAKLKKLKQLYLGTLGTTQISNRGLQDLCGHLQNHLRRVCISQKWVGFS